MRDVALLSLAHDRGKLLASIAGVAFAATLLLVQIGLFVGFCETSSALIQRVGGDVWVMAKGTEVLDNGDMLSAGTRAAVASHPCVDHVRGLIVKLTLMRKPSGAPEAVEIVGYEPDASRVLPWSLERGLPGDLHPPRRVAVDSHDIERLQIDRDPIGTRLEIAGRGARVAAVMHGIRSFSLAPYVFTELENARELVGAGDGQADYWIAHLRDPSCAADVTRTISQHRDLEAHTTEGFRRITESYWVYGSGAGAALLFSAVFSLVVGAVVVGQTLFSITKEHLKELATLKALGASRGELTAFVAWQASVLAVLGGGAGMGMAFALHRVLSSQGIVCVLNGVVYGVGAMTVLVMCALASVPSVRRVLRVEAAEVFR
jgi:putative ABC transport system permease protein